MTVYVGNLSFELTEDAIRDVFGDYGSVKNVKVPMDRETGRMRGFAFVEMATEEEEQTVIDTLDGAEWMGRTLKVNKARPRTENRPT